MSASRRRITIAAVLAVVAVAAMIVASQIVRVDAERRTERAERVVLFGIPHLGMDDLGSGDLPTLDRLVEGGATAAASVRTASLHPSTVEAYASLSAGARVTAGGTAALAVAADAPLEGSTASDVVERRAGIRPTGHIVLPDGPLTIDRADEDDVSPPGTLGAALAYDGLRTAVVGNADEVSPSGEPVLSRPAAIAAMRRDSSVSTGAVGDHLLTADPASPFGLRTDRQTFLDAARQAFDAAQFIVLDPGETDRAYGYRPVAAEDQAEALRRAALRDTDELLAAVVDELPPGTMLLVVGVTPPTRTWELTPVVASGTGVVPGALHSLSTKRAGLVTMPDITATIADALGAPVPGGVIGSPFEYRPGDVSISRLQEANDVAVSRERIYFPMSLTFIIVQALFYLLLVAVLALAGAPRPLRTAIRLAVLTFAAWPLATYLIRMWPFLMTLGHVTHIAVWLASLGIALAASRLRRHPLAPLGAICLATAVLLLIDVSTGARLQSASILGYSPHTSTRFFGFGNTAIAILAPCALVAAVLHIERSPRRSEATAVSAILLGVVVVADGAPWLGSDIGGILSLVPVFGLTLAVVAGRRLSIRTVLVAVAGTLLVLGLAVGADVLRPDTSRTHLANFVLDSRDGGTFWTTISRKWSANLRVFRQSYWTWTVPVIAVGAGYLLVRARRSRELLPEGSALRAGVLGVLAVGVLGWLVNDSGIVVTALALVYALPFLVLLAIEQPWSWRESRR